MLPKSLPITTEKIKNNTIVEIMNIGIYLIPAFISPFFIVAIIIDEKYDVMIRHVIANILKSFIDIPPPDKLIEKLVTPEGMSIFDMMLFIMLSKWLDNVTAMLLSVIQTLRFNKQNVLKGLQDILSNPSRY